MLRIKLFRILYGDDNCDYLIQKINKDCLNNITAFLCKGYTLNNETIYSIKAIQYKTYTYEMFKESMSMLLNCYDDLDDYIAKIKQSEILYRYINIYYSKVANTNTNRFTNACYIKAKSLQTECKSLYLDLIGKILHNYNTRKNLKMKEELHKLNVSCAKFTREIETAIYLLRETNKKYSLLPPSIWN